MSPTSLQPAVFLKVRLGHLPPRIFSGSAPLTEWSFIPEQALQEMTFQSCSNHVLLLLPHETTGVPVTLPHSTTIYSLFKAQLKRHHLEKLSPFLTVESNCCFFSNSSAPLWKLLQSCLLYIHCYAGVYKVSFTTRLQAPWIQESDPSMYYYPVLCIQQVSQKICWTQMNVTIS